MTPPRTANTVRFGPFLADLAACELRRDGTRIKIQEQPFRILAILLERPGEVVSREEIRAKLWPADTFVEFEHSLNTAVNRLRAALGDSAGSPQYIETIPRRGYRFVGDLERPAPRSGGLPKPPQGLRPWQYAAGGAAALAILAILAWVFQPSPPQPLPPPIRLTTYDGHEFYPTFSPDCSQVAFTWNGGSGRKRSLYVKSLKAEDPRKLVEHERHVFAPSWSPDGSLIAYAVELPDDRYEVRVIPPAGGADQLISTLGPGQGGGVLSAASLAWSPDGRYLAVSEIPEGSQAMAIFLLNPDTREKRQLTFPPPEFYGDAHARFSHSGDQLAFVRNAATYSTGKVYVLALDRDYQPAGEPRHIPVLAEKPPTAVFYPAWTEDDSEILASSFLGLWRVPVDGANQANLIAERAWQPAACRAGGMLAFTRRKNDQDIWRLDRDSERAEPLIASSWVDFYPRISPDGSRILWTSQRTGFSEVWVVNADGTGAQQLTYLNNHAGARWSPNGETISVDARHEGSSNLYLMSSHGGPLRPLRTDATDEFGQSWSPSGEHIYFSSNRDGTRRIWRVQANGENPKPVTVEEGWIAELDPDGKYLYFSSSLRPKKVCRKLLPDGPETLVLEKVGFFAVARSGVYFTHEGPTGEVYLFDGKTGEVTLAFRSDKPVASFDISTDEETLVFATVQNSGSDLYYFDAFE